MSKPYKSMEYIEDYLYEVMYDELDYQNAYEYFNTKRLPIIPFSCSSIKNGNLCGRQLDWIYSEEADFIVNVAHSDKRLASYGIASTIYGLTDSFVKSGGDSDLYNILPFYTVDGKNECGVYINTNVVPLDKEPTTKTIPLISEKVELCMVMIPRYVLDHFKTAKEAVCFLRDYASIYPPRLLSEMGYEAHYMIADLKNTYLVELIDNQAAIIDISLKPYMTNFYISDAHFNNDGTVYTPETLDRDHLPSVINNITLYGSGLERYNLIVKNYDISKSKNGMRELLDMLMYSKAYDISTNPFWYTEFVGTSLTVNSPAYDYSERVTEYAAKWEHRSRDPESEFYGLWHTTHSIIYDLKTNDIYVIAQENGNEIHKKINFRRTSMVTSAVNVQKTVDDEEFTYYEFSGKSTDIKPTVGVFNGSTFFEMDTSDVYVFDGAETAWIKL